MNVFVCYAKLKDSSTFIVQQTKCSEPLKKLRARLGAC